MSALIFPSAYDELFQTGDCKTFLMSERRIDDGRKKNERKTYRQTVRQVTR